MCMGAGAGRFNRSLSGCVMDRKSRGYLNCSLGESDRNDQVILIGSDLGPYLEPLFADCAAFGYRSNLSW